MYDWVNKLGGQILEKIAEDADKALKDSAERKRQWKIVQKDTRGILTDIGEVNISRSYYRHKKTGEYAYLANEVLKLPAFDQIDQGLKVDLIKKPQVCPIAKQENQTVMWK